MWCINNTVNVTMQCKQVHEVLEFKEILVIQTEIQISGEGERVSESYILDRITTRNCDFLVKSIDNIQVFMFSNHFEVR